MQIIDFTGEILLRQSTVIVSEPGIKSYADNTRPVTDTKHCLQAEDLLSKVNYAEDLLSKVNYCSVDPGIPGILWIHNSRKVQTPQQPTSGVIQSHMKATSTM